MSRIIGIQHRIKKTAKGEAHPTRVFIIDVNSTTSYELADEQAELDFVTGRFPTSYRDVTLDNNLSDIKPWHLKLRKVKEGEEVPAYLIVTNRDDAKQPYRVAKVPTDYDGIQEGDVIAMVLGGSGDYLAAAAGRMAARKGGKVIRIAPFNLQNERETAGHEDKDQDAKLLATLVSEKPHLFYDVAERDQGLILVRERQQLRIDTMKARIACEQRLRQRVIGNIFTNPDGIFPEGGVEKAFDDLKANDAIYQALLREESRAERELTKALEALDVYQEVFKPIDGMGPMIAARIISATIDIRRFSKPSKFVAYAGVHVLKDGTFARRRNNQVANWHGDLRQALYLSSDQWNRRPDSDWGKYFKKMKAGYRERYPEPVKVDNGKGKMVMRYTNGHIHKLAQWRTMTRFTERLYANWKKFEHETRGQKPQADELSKAA